MQIVILVLIAEYKIMNLITAFNIILLSSELHCGDFILKLK